MASLDPRSTDRGRIAILAGSAALHIGVLAALGLAAIEHQNDIPLDQPAFVIEMTPRLRLDGQTPRASEAPQAASLETRNLTAVGPLAAVTLPTDVRPSLPEPRVATGVPLPGASLVAPPDADSAAIGRALRNGALGCRLGRSSPAQQDRCDRALAEAAARADPIRGTGNPDRDTRFAALGAEALARYEDKRKPLKPYSRAEPCPGSPTPGDDCAFSIQGRIWSNRDGWLPDLPRPH